MSPERFITVGRGLAPAVFDVYLTLKPLVISPSVGFAAQLTLKKGAKWFAI